MATIGAFSKAKNGGWEGSIRTLSAVAKVRFIPNDNRESDTSPHFRVVTGNSEVGVAWLRRTAGERREYLSVQLDDPVYPKPISAALFLNDDMETAQLVWNRRHLGDAHER